MPLLQSDPQLNAVTLLEELQRRHPGDYDSSVRRTLQRRVRQWRAVHGAEREVFFAQEHPPGRLGLSDFTVCNALGVELDAEPFLGRHLSRQHLRESASSPSTRGSPRWRWCATSAKLQRQRQETAP